MLSAEAMTRSTRVAVTCAVVLAVVGLEHSVALADGGGGGANFGGLGKVHLHASSPGRAPSRHYSSGGRTQPRHYQSGAGGTSGSGAVSATPVHLDPERLICGIVNVCGVPPGALAGSPVPAVAPAVRVDPGRLAQRAVGELQLPLAQPRTAPAFPDMTVVGVEVWMWVPEGQWTTLIKSVKAGGTRVTVRAEPSYVTWRTGERPRAAAGVTIQPTVKRCYGASGATRAWRLGMTDAATTACGHTYRSTSKREPGGVFHLSAALTYQVTWTCTGDCATPGGTLGEVSGPQAQARLRSVQRQTVTVS